MGRPFPDGSMYPGDCSKTALVWIDKEGSMAISHQRLEALGIDTDRIFTPQEDSLACDETMSQNIKALIRHAESKGWSQRGCRV